MAASLHDYAKGFGKIREMNTTDKILSLIHAGIHTTTELAEQLPEVSEKSLSNLIVSLKKRELISVPISVVNKKGKKIRNSRPQIYSITDQGIDKLSGLKTSGLSFAQRTISNSVFVRVLAIWLAESDRSNQWVSAVELNTALKEIVEKQQLDWPWKTGAGLGTYINTVKLQLKRMFGLKIKDGTSRTGKRYKFTRS